MQSTFCVNCKQPLPAGAAFCGNCGARQAPPNHAAPTQLSTPPADNIAPAQAAPPPAAGSSAPTQVSAPPVPQSGDHDPTRLVPPPPPDATLQASMLPTVDQYASQYHSPPPPFSQYQGPGSGPPPSGPYPPPQAPYAAPPPPPGYAPGPPPVMAPGGGVAPWAQPQKKSGRRFALGCVAAIVLVVLVLGGGSVLALRLLTSGKSSNPSANTNSNTGTTPGAGSTAGTTPGTGPGGAQTLSNLNLQAIYAGVKITIIDAVQAPTVPEYDPHNPDEDALKIQARLDNSQDTHTVYVTSNTRVVGPNGTPYDTRNGSASNSLPLVVEAQANVVGYWYFAVPHGTKISDWKLVLGEAKETLVAIPLNGVGYDPSVWEWVTKPITEKNTVTYYDGALVGTVSKVTTGFWTPGFQAPKDKRFLLVNLAVTNNSAAGVYIGDPEFALLLPNGERQNQQTSYGYFINEVLGGHESKDLGYVCFVVPPEPGHFQMLFFNQDNGLAGTVDLGTI